MRSFTSIISSSGSLVRLRLVKSHYSQSSSRSAAIRENSRVLCVTSVRLCRRATAAILRSWPDHLALALECAPDFSAFHRARVIEGERGEGRQERVQLRVFSTLIRTRFGAVTQLVHDNRTENDVRAFRRLPASNQTRLLLTKQGNAGVRVRKKDHSSGSRSSNAPWDPRRRFGIEPATRSKNPSGQPFASTEDPAGTGVTVTTTATSASGMSTSTFKFSLPSFVVRARVSMVLLAMPQVYRNWCARSSGAIQAIQAGWQHLPQRCMSFVPTGGPQ